MWVAIHKCMESMPGISLYSYLYLRLEKMLYLFYHLLWFLFNKIREQEGMGRSREVAQTMYRHVNKCKNDKIKERKKRKDI
jgi:hypothetical protein